MNKERRSSFQKGLQLRSDSSQGHPSADLQEELPDAALAASSTRNLNVISELNANTAGKMTLMPKMLKSSRGAGAQEHGQTWPT